MLEATLASEPMLDTVVEVSLYDDDRDLAGAVVNPVSKYAFSKLIKWRRLWFGQSVSDLYDEIKLMPVAGGLAGHMWKRAVHFSSGCSMARWCSV